MTATPDSDRAQLFWKFVATTEFPELGAGPRKGVLPRRTLEGGLADFIHSQDLDPATGTLLRATALLYHDHQDAAHDIVQDLNDSDAALLHGIVHRREPDYWNAKYWFRRCEMHPIYAALAPRLKAWKDSPANTATLDRLTLPGTFDPFAFVDACEAADRLPNGAESVGLLRRVQHAEFEEIVRHLLA
jgi:hypothetical protein